MKPTTTNITVGATILCVLLTGLAANVDTGKPTVATVDAAVTAIISKPAKMTVIRMGILVQD
jgi:hypothetical protein